MIKKIDLPLVSIALPVYNEGKFIQETIESLLAQDYGNFEIIISDNASNDNTSQICESYSRKYSNIKYIRQEKNIGPSENSSFLAKTAKGKYYMLAAGHDKWSANLISQSVQALETNPNANIAFSTPIWIDENGNFLDKHSGWYDTRGLQAVARFFMVFWGSMNPILGVMRLTDLPKLRKNYDFVGGDLVMLLELAMAGEFLHVTDACFYRRQNRPPEKFYQRVKRYKSKEVRLAKSISKIFPLSKLPLEICNSVLSSKIGLLNKLLIFLILIPSLPSRYFIGRKYS